MWVRHIYDFPFRWVRHRPSSVTVSFKATKIPTTKIPTLPTNPDVPVVIRAIKFWKALRFPSTIGVDNVAFRSYQKPVNSEK